MIGMDDMNRITKNTGSRVSIVVIEKGEPVPKEGELLGISGPFLSVRVKTGTQSHEWIPFVGLGIGVRKITLDDGTVIFDNPEVEGFKSSKDLPEVRERSYGKEVAQFLALDQRIREMSRNFQPPLTSEQVELLNKLKMLKEKLGIPTSTE